MLIEDTKDFLVRCDNPEWFDDSIRTHQAALLVYGWNGRYIYQNGCYVMRSFGEPESLKAYLREVEQCEIIGECKAILRA